LNETSPVCLFPTPKETITEVKIRIGGGRKIEIFGSGGAKPILLVDSEENCIAGTSMEAANDASPAGLPKTISEVGVHFFLRLFREKENVGKIFQSHAKWRVSSEMNIERSARRLKRGVKTN